MVKTFRLTRMILRDPFPGQSAALEWLRIVSVPIADGALPVSDDGNAVVAAELAALLSFSLPDQQPESAASDQGRGNGIFPGSHYHTVDETSLRVAHRTIPFTVSLSFSSWRIVSRGARLRGSSRLMPIANSTPAITAATIAEVR